MKNLAFYALFLILLILLPVRAQKKSVGSSDLQRITSNASYEFANIKMYKDEASWRGKTVAFSGIIQKTPVIAKTKREYLQITGQTANGAVNVVIFLDSPIPTIDNYGNQVPSITPGMEVRVFIQLHSLMNYTSESGYLLSLPTGDGLMIFSKDDYSMTNPLWASKLLTR